MPSDTETFGDVVARLRQAQKPKAQTPLYLQRINRPAGGYLAAAAFVRGTTPNQLTAVSAFLSLGGVALLAALPPSWPLGIGVSVCLLVGYAFDSADGQLARLRGGGSPAGEWLDHVVDAVKTCALHSAVLVSTYRFVPDAADVALFAPLVFVTAAITTAFGSMLRDQLIRGRVRSSDAGDSTARSIALLPVDFGILGLAFLLLGSWPVFMTIYSSLALINVLFTVRLSMRTYRRLASL